jgi:hypothetical protein
VSDADQAATSDSVEPAPGTDAERFTAQLTALDALPVAEHADVYQSVHTALQAALAEIDAR